MLLFIQICITVVLLWPCSAFKSRIQSHVRCKYSKPTIALSKRITNSPINNIQLLSMSFMGSMIPSTEALLAKAAINPGSLTALLKGGTAVNLGVTAILAIIATRVVLGSTTKMLSSSSLTSPYQETGGVVYNPDFAIEYFGKNQLLVINRLAKLSKITGGFIVNLFTDFLQNKIKENESIRAKEITSLITQLGPAFVKLGQTLSIRSDLIPDTYAKALRQLHDSVPPFPTEEAMEILRKHLNVSDLKSVFQSISDKPVAAASIGQVYKAMLLDGREVAVKIQRPNIMTDIALDIYILRRLAPYQVRLFNILTKKNTNNDDILRGVALVDEWGKGFIAEVDYLQEAKNGLEFNRAMESRGINAVMAPQVVEELSGSRVLVSEWIYGTRIDKEASPDVPRLCGVALNAYLTMLLDTGVLHCDPHPGNLIRTQDGRLCILDWGMTINVPSDLQYSLLEFISHIAAEDFDALPNDFVNLGFCPPNQTEVLKSSGMAEGIAYTFRQLNKGGGPRKLHERMREGFRGRYGDLSDYELSQKVKEDVFRRMGEEMKQSGVDVSGVNNIVEELSRKNRDLFKLPPYMLYISRAFATLEGIGLAVDENYSIVQECYPYIARRLFTDNNPRAKAALRTMLMGGSSNSVISPSRLVEMASGFKSFVSSTTDTDQEGRGSKVAGDALFDIMMSPEGNAVQDIVIEGLAKMTDAVVRDRLSVVSKSPPSKLLQRLMRATAQTSDAILPGPLSVPFKLPHFLSQSLIKLTAPSEEDEVSLKTLRSFLSLVNSKSLYHGEDNDQNGHTENIPLVRLATALMLQALKPNSEIRKLVLRPNVFRMMGFTRKFGAALMSRAADRIESVSIQNNQKSMSDIDKPISPQFAKASYFSNRSNKMDMFTLITSVMSKSARTIAVVLSS